jgi:hypothetical protein
MNIRQLYGLPSVKYTLTNKDMRTYIFYTFDENRNETIHFEVKCIQPKRTKAYKTVLNLFKNTPFVYGFGFKSYDNKYKRL